MGIRFLTTEQVLHIHADLIEQYGGAEGIRDEGLLHSAVAMPQASFGGQPLHEDLFAMAAAYLFHIVKDHPFLDGNKRTGAASAIVFLTINGVVLEADEDRLVDVTVGVARGQAGKEETAEFFRSIAH